LDAGPSGSAPKESMTFCCLGKQMTSWAIDNDISMSGGLCDDNALRLSLRKDADSRQDEDDSNDNEVLNTARDTNGKFVVQTKPPGP